jgi:methionine-S-sulfoxide reductase
MIKIIVLGGGCFWCIEAVFQKIHGVQIIETGYAGGSFPEPTYEQVCLGETDHAETVRLEYDSDKISLENILDVFFSIHDPTTLNRQDMDVGTQYRSIILWTEPEQKKISKKYLDKIKNDFKNPVVTQLKKLNKFYPAEDYHLDYYNKNKSQPYCQFVVSPKIKQFENHFPDLIK